MGFKKVEETVKLKCETQNREMRQGKRGENPHVKTNLHNSCSAPFRNSGFIRTRPLDCGNTQAVTQRECVYLSVCVYVCVWGCTELGLYRDLC